MASILTFYLLLDTISGGFMSPSIAEDATESLRGHLQKPNEGLSLIVIGRMNNGLNYERCRNI